MSHNNKSVWEKEWPKAWSGFWKPLLLTGGKWSERKIRNELHDLVFVVDQVSDVYCYITGSQLSKPMYYADTIKTAYDQSVDDASREYAREEIAGAIDEIGEWIKDFNGQYIINDKFGKLIRERDLLANINELRKKYEEQI
jgi:hypothetical protein